MPRTKDPRVPVTVRLSPDGLAAIEQQAAVAGVSRSEVIRRLLRAANIPVPPPEPAPKPPRAGRARKTPTAE